MFLSFLGYICLKLQRRAICKICKQALAANPQDQISEAQSMLIKRKARGKLTVPSLSVVKLIKWSERVFRDQVVNAAALPQRKNLADALTLQVTMSISKKEWSSIFPMLDAHLKEHNIGIETNHLLALAKTVIKRYLEFRCKSYIKSVSVNDELNVSKRNDLAKLLHNLGQ